MAVSGDLEALKLKIFLARRQPWWRLVRFGPPNTRNVPTPLHIMRINYVSPNLLILLMHGLRPYSHNNDYRHALIYILEAVYVASISINRQRNIYTEYWECKLPVQILIY